MVYLLRTVIISFVLNFCILYTYSERPTNEVAWYIVLTRGVPGWY